MLSSLPHSCVLEVFCAPDASATPQKEPTTIKLSNRKAFAAFFRAAGVNVEPASSMPYDENDSISMYRRKLKCLARDVGTDVEVDQVHAQTKKQESASDPAGDPAAKRMKLIAAGA